MGNLKIVRKLLRKNKISDFAKSWIKRTPIKEEDVQETYKILKSYGLSDEKIAKHAELLARKPKDIERAYEKLSRRGINGNTLKKYPEILGTNWGKIELNQEIINNAGLNQRGIDHYIKVLCKSRKSIEENYKELKKMGLRDNKIATHIGLLARNHEKIKENFGKLERLGLSKEEIINHADLLTRNYDTLKRNYHNHARLLNNEKKGLAAILAISPETVNASYQYLDYIGISKTSSAFPVLLSTRPMIKRKKVAWILREIGYRNIPEGERKNAIKGIYRFIREHPKMLTKSYSALEKGRECLKKKIKEYIPRLQEIL